MRQSRACPPKNSFSRNSCIDLCLTLFPWARFRRHKAAVKMHYDEETQKHLVFLTNNFTLPALTIAQIYKRRWQIELCFKWIKQNLRIKAFFGTSDNAVKTQLWIAVCVYLLVAIVKKELKLEPSLSIILQVLSVNVSQQEPLPQLVTQDIGVFPKT